MMTEPTLTHRTEYTETISDKPEDFFIRDFEANFPTAIVSSKYLPNENFACLGCEDGVTRILSTSAKKVQYNLVKEDKSPVAAVACGTEHSNIKNSVLVAHTGGTLEYWHATSEQLLFSKKHELPLESCEISCNNQWYVVSEDSGEMFLGHLNKGDPTSLETGNIGSHSNRVFCIKWSPEDPNIFYSGGWDKSLLFWDIRSKTSVHKLFGYYIGGQAIDAKNHELLLGNNTNENQLRLYDIKADKVRLIRWEHYNEKSLHGTTGVNSCSFGLQKQQYIALTSRNQIRLIIENKCLSLFEHEDPEARGYSMCTGQKNKSIVCTWGNGDVKVLSY